MSFTGLNTDGEKQFPMQSIGSGSDKVGKTQNDAEKENYLTQFPMKLISGIKSTTHC